MDFYKNIDNFQDTNKNNSIEIDNTKHSNNNTYLTAVYTGPVIIMLIFILIWWITGIIGFIMSILCCFYNGSITDKALGILFAWVLGPFYWLFFIYNSNYCTRFNPIQQQPSYY